MEKIGWVSIKTLHWISIIQCSNLLKVGQVWGQISCSYNVEIEIMVCLVYFWFEECELRVHKKVI